MGAPISSALGAHAAAIPSLAAVIADPGLARDVSLPTLVEYRRQAAHLVADLDAVILLRVGDIRGQPLAGPRGIELTVDQVAARLNRPAAYIRVLLRRKDLPGFRRGKYWVVLEQHLLEWQTSQISVDHDSSLTLPSARDVSRGDQAHPEAARSYSVEVRHASRGARRKRQKVGGGIAEDAPTDRTLDSAASRPRGDGAPTAAKVVGALETPTP
jgi:hypothetical protein